MFRISHNPSSGYTIYKFTREYVPVKQLKNNVINKCKILERLLIAYIIKIFKTTLYKDN